MPAINALLPIVAASNSQKESTQSRADESRISDVKNAVKSAASAEKKGLEQDAAAEKRMQQKRFINAYEESIQEQGREQERRAQEVASRELAQRDDAAALALSGNALPQVSGPLPTSTSERSAQNGNADATKPLQTQVPSAASAPMAQQSAPAEQPVVAQPHVIETLTFEQQQAAADAFHALVNAQNGKAEGKPQAALAVEQQGIASAASSQAQAVDPALASDVALSNAMPQASTEALDSPQQELTSTSKQNEEGLAIQPQTGQSAALLAAALVGNEAKSGGDEPEQAQLVRAWRGVDGQELRSAASVTTQATIQAKGQDPVAASVPISLSGQIQQFAQSLRLARGQPDAAASGAKGDRGAASAPQSSAELSPWRADSASPNAASTSGRVAAPNIPFAQAMQASNFGQPLGQPVGQNAWGESIAQRVSLMAGLKAGSAQIQLDPPELGALTVKVSVTGDQASVTFHSPHAVVRDALELSFPRLQEMMGQQGMQLVDAQVSDNSSARQGSGESTSGRTGQTRGDAQDEGANSATPQIVEVATGLIDFYA